MSMAALLICGVCPLPVTSDSVSDLAEERRGDVEFRYPGGTAPLWFGHQGVGTACESRGGHRGAHYVVARMTEEREASRVGRRVLVGYATGSGSTAGVAEVIGEVLAERGFEVDVRLLDDRPPCTEYDAIVLGSAVNGGRWLPVAATYIEANAGALAAVPVAVFCVHAMNTGEGEKKRRKRMGYLDPVRAQITPVAEGYFAGTGPSAADTSALARLAFRTFGGDVEGDGRDWDAIREWARELELQR